MALIYLKEFFVLLFSVTMLMMSVILCISAFMLPWILGVYLETLGASFPVIMSTVIFIYSIYWVACRSAGLIKDMDTF